MPTQKNPALRGRPVTNTAKSSTERGKALEDALRKAGGRILSRVRLSPDAATALALLSDQCGSDRAAIEQALLDAAKKIN